jgi:probable addiction module antidote protein
MMTRKIKITDFDSSKYLKNEESITEYLKASWEMNDPEVFLAALATAAKARGMTQLAREAGVCRESLYRSLSPEGNPSFKTVFKIAVALGLSFDAVRDASHHGAPLS